MSKITEYAIELVFETDLHGSLSITVPDVKSNVTDAQVVNAMTRIIDANAVSSTAGQPIAIEKAQLITTETTNYDLT